MIRNNIDQVQHFNANKLSPFLAAWRVNVLTWPLLQTHISQHWIRYIDTYIFHWLVPIGLFRVNVTITTGKLKKNKKTVGSCTQRAKNTKNN